MTQKELPEKYEDTVREMIRHENDLTNDRITWLLTVEGLLFAALGLAWDKPDARPLVLVFCCLGAILAAVCSTGLIGAQRAIRRLKDLWKEKMPTEYQDPDVIGYRGEDSIIGVFSPWKWFPAIFVVAWLAIAVLNFRRS